MEDWANDACAITLLTSPRSWVKIFQHHIVADGEAILVARAQLDIHDDLPGVWGLTEIETEYGHQNCGYGRILIQEIRRWAKSDDCTVYTVKAREESRGFFAKVGAQWQPDTEEFLIFKPAGT